MWRTNLKIVLTVVGTLAVYTGVANMIPQVRSEVPETLQLGADATPEELVAAGERVYRGAGGCEACHGLGTRAPDLLGEIGTRCAERVPEMGCKEYLHESMVNPGAYVVEGFQPIMPDMSRTLSPVQIWAVVAFLESQGGEVTVTSADIPATGGAGAGAGTGGAGGAGGGGETAASAPAEIFRTFGCPACHLFQGEGAEIGPPFAEMAGKDPAYIRRGILEPNADTAQGYEAMAGTMPPNFGERMSEAQIDAVVEYLARGGEGGDGG